MKAFFAAVTAGMIGSSMRSERESNVVMAAPQPHSLFDVKEFQPYALTDIQDASPDSKIFRFALPTPQTPLNLPVASYILFRYKDTDGKDVVRPYTPIDESSARGHFDVLIKKYPNSKMGSYLFSLKKGDKVEIMGGNQTIEVKPSQYTEIGMIAGGTGITPMFQTLRHVVEAPKNTTKVSLLFANNTKDDILLGDLLEGFQKKYTNTFTAYYCLTEAPKNWKGFKGYIDKHMIKETMPAIERAKDSIILVCGPPPFMKAISGPKDYTSMPPKQGELAGYLKELGYPQSMVYKF